MYTLYLYTEKTEGVTKNEQSRDRHWHHWAHKNRWRRQTKHKKT